MIDIIQIATQAKVTLSEIANHAFLLGTGLQNAAPGDKSGKGNDSINYLLSIAELLRQLTIELNQILPTDAKPTPNNKPSQ